jgi:hypothetical protein
MSSESIKNSIISEIEENLSFASSSTKPKLFEEDVFSLCADRDNLISKLALQKALLHGIDSRYINVSFYLNYYSLYIYLFYFFFKQITFLLKRILF